MNNLCCLLKAYKECCTCKTLWCERCYYKLNTHVKASDHRMAGFIFSCPADGKEFIESKLMKRIWDLYD